MASTGTAPTSSQLVAHFYEFYAEVVRFKKRLAEAASRDPSAAPPSPGPGPAGESEQAGPTLPSIQDALIARLESQSWSAQLQRGDLAGELQRQAQFVMAALADDVFLNLDWSGREAWLEQLLEARLYGSHRAGEVFFKRLDFLLARRDPMYSDLAQVYLLALSLGFEGKYRGKPEAQTELALYRQRLFRLVYHRDPGLLASAEQMLPQAYAVTLEAGSGRPLPYLRRWGALGVFLVLVWILAGHWIWKGLVGDLVPILRGILS
ncbi:MAG TPA: DotU family type IV/VI secretion system protein [Thermoanaerobaculia bacterium]|nr:DotU family type IV/VI secretion system protein [Thermoanaerobaculia bacterium]